MSKYTSTLTRLHPLLLGLLVTTVGASSPVTVDDFEDGDLRGQGGAGWITYSDKVAGGKSSAAVTVIDGGPAQSRKALRIAFTITPDFISGFAGARVNVRKDGTPIDVTTFKGVRFDARGSTDAFVVQVVSAAVTDYNDFSKQFVGTKEWMRHEVLFSDLQQNPFWGKKVAWTGKDIRGIGFHSQGAPGAFSLDVDNIEFF